MILVDLVRELKTLYNMRVTVIPIVVGALGMIHKDLVRGLEEVEIGGVAEIIQTTAFNNAVGRPEY